jgi:transcriptional regulator with XRE-family HTH domain
VKQDEHLHAMLKKIGKRLEELRREAGYTSHETFAYDFDFSRMHYWQAEKGKVNLTIKSLLRILKAHNLTFEEFVASLKKTEK